MNLLGYPIRAEETLDGFIYEVEINGKWIELLNGSWNREKALEKLVNLLTENGPV